MTEQPRRRQRRLRWRYVIGVPLVVVVAVALGVGIANHNASQPQTDRLSVGAIAPDGAFTTVDGQATTIAALRGRPALVWFVTTFCDSCQAGTQVMAQQINQFTHHHVKVVELELHANLGGDGPDIATFGRQIAGNQFTNPDWLWGTASQALTTTYDPKAYLDVYYLLDAHGHIDYINSGPESTMSSLLDHVNALGT